MAEYIKKEDLKFLEIPIAPVIQGEQVHYEQGFLKEWLESVPTADVIERSEYDRMVESFKTLVLMKEENVLQYRKANKDLHNKIDKAIEVFRKEIEENHLNVIDYVDREWLVKDFIYGAIDRLKRNIGE